MAALEKAKYLLSFEVKLFQLKSFKAFALARKSPDTSSLVHLISSLLSNRRPFVDKLKSPPVRCIMLAANKLLVAFD